MNKICYHHIKIQDAHLSPQNEFKSMDYLADDIVLLENYGENGQGDLLV